MTTDTGTDIYYTVHVTNNNHSQGGWKRNFTIPKGTLSANLVDLPVYTP